MNIKIERGAIIIAPLSIQKTKLRYTILVIKLR
jgi:hypothetical protein